MMHSHHITRLLPTVLMLAAAATTTAQDSLPARSLQPMDVNERLMKVDTPTAQTPEAEASTNEADGTAKPLPYSASTVRERVVLDHGKRAIRIDSDKSFSTDPVNKKNCFILMSKKDYYLYVYEDVDGEKVLRARYDCAFALRKGNKTKQGDMRTPHCTKAVPEFSISQICPASAWRHNFGDGRGNILAYGAWFLRLNIGTGNRSIGIHGSTNNAESVPGRASEGCIRLRDADIIDLKTRYVWVGMKVIIKEESEDDRPFEVQAMRRQRITRKRHLDPKLTLTNAQIDAAKAEQK